MTRVARTRTARTGTKAARAFGTMVSTSPSLRTEFVPRDDARRKPAKRQSGRLLLPRNDMDSFGENQGLDYCTYSPVNVTEIYPTSCSLQTIESAIANSEWNMMCNDVTCCNNVKGRTSLVRRRQKSRLESRITAVVQQSIS